MTRGGHRWIALGLALACAALAAGCGEMATSWVEENREDSAAADEAIREGDHDEAIDHLRRIAERAPARGVAEEDARVVRQDAYDRWARIELARGDTASAERLVDRGLGLGERDDVFTANLLTTRGRLHEMSGRDREAARNYHRALLIEEGLLDRALGGAE
jgi:tetratricopeptide (TPR) repeat protein